MTTDCAPVDGANLWVVIVMSFKLHGKKKEVRAAKINFDFSTCNLGMFLFTHYCVLVLHGCTD